MSFWDRLRGRGKREERASEPPREPPPPAVPAASADARAAPATDVTARVAGALSLDGAARATALRELLGAARGTADESAAVTALAAAASRLDDDVAAALARLLHDRGELRAAREVLAQARSIDALLLAADLDAERGDVGAALAGVERVLARRLDAPGARERWERWSRALGAGAARRGLDDAVTVLAPAPAGVPYRILREVARGGAGTVYQAEETGLGRTVAFKVYHAGRRDRAALEREAQVAAALAGPGVVRVLDASPVDGWIALEWAPGGSLRDVLRDRRAGELARWVRDLAGALRRVHGAGWVHGDVKPANALLTEGGDALLTDFGIARRAGEAAGGGSPGYVSPERLALAPAAPADDVYGLGRVVEDLLDAGVEAPPWAPAFLQACLAPGPGRLADGEAMVAWLQDRGA